MIRHRQLPANGSGIQEFDPFAAAADTPSPQPDESPVQLLYKMHRLLRGRYVLAIILGALGAAGGAIGGYFATAPKWQSFGSIKIEPTRPIYLEKTPETEIPYFDSYVQEQIISLEEQKTLDRAFMSPAWQKYGRGTDMQAKRRFRDSLSVNVDRSSRKWIKVRFVDVDPAAARTAVQEIVDAYREIFGPGLLMPTETTIQSLKREKEKFELDIRTMESRIAELGRPFGTTDLTARHKAKQDEYTLALEEFNKLSWHIGQAEVAAQAAAANPDAPAPRQVEWQEAALEIARVDAGMNALVQKRDDAETEHLRLQKRYTPENPVVHRAAALVSVLDTQIEDRVKSWLNTHGNQLPGANGAAGPLLSAEPIDVLKARAAKAAEVVARYLDEANKINDTRLEIERIQIEIATKKRDLAKHQERLNELNLENTSQSPTQATKIGRIEIISDGDEAIFYSDARKKLAALGFLLGGSLPVFAVMLLGALDRRYRYSDEAQSGSSHVPLLGILPYLPDRLSDPEQAGIAAHCVHQIRTLLQIGGVEHDRRVFAVTSATSGDGKTSLCLSLGLSFAASGSNTCLIDFDMVGGGLTAGMGLRTDVGLLAAIDDGQLDGHIRPTAFPRLSMIPAGRDDAQEISRLSPKLVRRLIEQARKQFDVVIIDTGPILGSIEATLVCGIADGVILALGRGQQRSMATRAIDTLRGVGAHVMGVVFNRAQPNDFRRTVSQSVRSVPVHDVDASSSIRALPGMGPVARTVVSHTRSDG